MAAVGGVEDALKGEQYKVETLQKMISLQNGNAKAVQLWNIQQAIDWFKQKEGDTGSPEVQGIFSFLFISFLKKLILIYYKISFTFFFFLYIYIYIAAVLTVRIHNLYSHLQHHKKDKHNYRQLRLMVHQRAKLLKYLKSKDATRYHACLEGLGLEPRAVEGEITL